MAQNIYDDEGFFAGYSTLPRSVHGLDAAPEWPTLRSLLPPLRGCRVVDLGCGFGWFSRWAASEGAADVLGIDLSERMLERARRETATTPTASNVRFERSDLEDVTLPVDAFDVAYSSLTLHYLVDLPTMLSKVQAALAADGVFVFSVEHPIYTAPRNPAFEIAADGTVTWPLNDYLLEGPRITNWFAPGVVKQHRTIGAYVGALRDAGFALDALVEWGPNHQQLVEVPAWANEVHRPPFLLVKARRA